MFIKLYMIDGGYLPAASQQCTIRFNDFEVTQKDCLVPSKSLFMYATSILGYIQ